MMPSRATNTRLGMALERFAVRNGGLSPGQGGATWRTGLLVRANLTVLTGMVRLQVCGLKNDVSLVCVHK
jgi:hypothetical protein